MHKRFGLAPFFAVSLLAQDAPPTRETITFVPPPLEGTLSVGVFTREGKLLRILAREATEKDFTIGLNGFILQWDGKDDGGTVLPAGIYFVRGFAVGELEVEGVAFHGNEWIKDEESPRMAEITGIGLTETELIVRGIAPDGKKAVIAAVHTRTGAVRFIPEEGSVPNEEKEARKGWAIERVGADPPPHFAVVERSQDGKEVLRRLDYEPTEPQPQKVLARADDKSICILERNERETRVRVLALQESSKSDGDAVSDWGIVFSASIRKPPAPPEVPAFLNRNPPIKLEDTIRQPLIRNELAEVSQAAVQLAVAIDGSGSYLRTADGLPLRRVTDTPNLKWAALSRDPDGRIILFQTDGATVEEFRIGKLNQMMAFDAGDYEWTPQR